MTRPTCATCAYWEQWKNVLTGDLVPIGRCHHTGYLTRTGDSCSHHTPTARDAGTEDERE